MSDPYAVDWRPRYTGPDGELGDVGSGRGFGADLHQLYRAGRLLLPQVAATYVDLARQVHLTRWPAAASRHPDWHGQRAHTRWEQLRDELQRSLGASSATIAAAGEALVTIADRYVRADEDAVAEMRRLLDKHSEDYATPPHVVDEPPAPEDWPPRPAAWNGHGQPAT